MAIKLLRSVLRKLLSGVPVEPSALNTSSDESTSARHINHRDWIVSRQHTINNENSAYMLTAGVIVSSYVAGLLLCAGWILNSALITKSPDLQAGQLLAHYPNAAFPILVFAVVSVGYFHASTAIFYLYADNALQLIWLDKTMLALSDDFIQDKALDLEGVKAGFITRAFFSTPLLFACVLPPLAGALLTLVRFSFWIQPIQEFSLAVIVVFIVTCTWLVIALLYGAAVIYDIQRRYVAYKKLDSSVE